MTARAALAVAALLASGCSREVDSSTLGFRYEPPSSMKFVEEVPGPPAAAHFQNGLTVYAFAKPLAGVGEGALSPAFEQLRAELPSLPEKVVSAKSGTLPAGKVGRWELYGGGKRTLVYAVDGGARHLVITLTAPRAEFDRRANQLELSLSTLKLR